MRIAVVAATATAMVLTETSSDTRAGESAPTTASPLTIAADPASSHLLDHESSWGEGTEIFTPPPDDVSVVVLPASALTTAVSAAGGQSAVQPHRVVERLALYTSTLGRPAGAGGHALPPYRNAPVWMVVVHDRPFAPAGAAPLTGATERAHDVQLADTVYTVDATTGVLIGSTTDGVDNSHP